jgi:hypothetical protein
MEIVGNAVRDGNGVGEAMEFSSICEAVCVLPASFGGRTLQEPRKMMETIQKYRCGVNLFFIVIHPKLQRICGILPVNLFIPCRCYSVVAGMSQFGNRLIILKSDSKSGILGIKTCNTLC